MELPKVLGERVRRQRMALGMSQTDLAIAVGIPIPNLSRIEHGHQSIYIERLVDLAKILHVSTDYLLGLTEDPAPSKRARRQRPAAAAPADGVVAP